MVFKIIQSLVEIDVDSEGIYTSESPGVRYCSEQASGFGNQFDTNRDLINVVNDELKGSARLDAIASHHINANFQIHSA